MAEDKKNTNGAAEAAKREDARSASTQDRVDASIEQQEAEREELRKPADIAAAPASKFEASGAIIEDGAKKMVDVDHPAVDNNPRAGTTVAQNRIDFNDPTLNDRQAVAERLDNQS